MTKAERNRHGLWVAKLMFFMSNASEAAIWSYLPVFYQSKGFSTTEIGLLQALAPLSVILGAPLYGAISDHLQQQRAVHNFIILSGAVVMFFVQFCQSFWSIAVLVFIACTQSAPVPSLLDQAVLSLLKQVGGEYGRQRLYASAGYAAGAYLTGVLITAYGINWMFNIHLLLGLVSFVTLQFLPVGDPVHDASLRVGLHEMKHRPDVFWLFTIVGLTGLCFGVIGSFFPLFVVNLAGGSVNLVGVATVLRSISEIPMFFFAERIIQKFGITNVLLLGILGYGVRISYYVIVVDPWTLLPFELLHSINFALLWAASTHYVYTAAAPGTEGTMIGLLTSMLYGYGKCFATLCAGWIYEHYSASAMWLATDIAVVLALLALVRFRETLYVAELHPLGDDVDILIDPLLSPQQNLIMELSQEKEKVPLLNKVPV